MTDLFNFISDEIFRASIEADYSELEKCMKAEAWKAVHVLAGSIVETLLIDYLIVTEYEKRSSKKIPKTLYDIIEVCKEEHVLSNKAADLAHAVREYRNLIHPEKIRRFEETVDENGAIVAQALVKMVIEGIAARRSQQVGLTAEQLVTKIERDPSVTSIIGHLLKNFREPEKKRLLINILPKRYIYLKISDIQIKDDFQKGIILIALEISYRTALNSSSKETKECVAKEFVRVLKEEDAQVVSLYEEVFFRGRDLEYFSSEDQQLFKLHFLSSLNKGIDYDLMRAADGIGEFLIVEDVASFVDSFVRGMVYDLDIDNDKAKKNFFAEFDKMGEKVQEEVAKRLKDWIYTFKQNQNEYGIKVLEKLKEEVDSRISIRSLPDFPDEEEIVSEEPDFPDEEEIVSEEPDFIDL